MYRLLKPKYVLILDLKLIILNIAFVFFSSIWDTEWDVIVSGIQGVGGWVGLT